MASALDLAFFGAKIGHETGPGQSVTRRVLPAKTDRMIRPTLLFVVLAGAASFAQAPTVQAPQAVFRSGVEIVRLDVRVVDADGRPVKDLRAEEINVYEGGQRRPIVLFQHIAEPTGTYLEVARRTIGGEVSTNQGSPRGHLYVLVFDQNHITPGNEQRVRIAAERFLQKRTLPGDRVALYALPGPGPQLAFSSNVKLAVSELTKIRGSLDRNAFTSAGAMSLFEAFQITRGDANALERVAARAVSTTGLVDLLPGTSNRRTPPTTQVADVTRIVTDNARTVVSQADSQARMFLFSLADVIRGLAGIEGRKAVIIVSEGFFSDNLARELEQVASAAAQAYAVVYSLDLNRRGAEISAADPVGGEQYAETQSRLEPLGTLAADTDGQLVLDAGSRADRALNQVADMSQDYYLVGFEPDASALANRDRYRRVTLSVSRPGVRVHARTGYSLRDPASVRDRRRAIDAALSAPFPQPGVPVEVTTYVMRGTSRGVHRVIVSLQAEVPVRSTRAPSADVVFVVKNASDGRVLTSGSDTMPLPAGARPGSTTGLGRFQAQFNAPPGEYLMRVAVREPGGSLGTADRRFEVRALDGVDITASDLIIGPATGRLPVRAVVRPDDGLTGLLEVYARRPADLDRIQVAFNLTRIGQETPVTAARADLLEVKTLAGGASRGAKIELPLNDIPAGQYLVRATVTAGGETVTELAREVEILPPGTPVDVDAVAPPERVPPVSILAGDLGLRLISALRDMRTDRGVVAAADQATAGDWKKVEATLRQAAPTYPARVLRGLAWFAGERFDESAGELNAALAFPSPEAAASPGDAKIRAMTSFLLGWVHACGGNELEAISAWRNATLLDPVLIPPYLALADMYVKRSQPALAAQVLRAGLAVVPGSFELQNKLSLVVGR